MRIKDFMAGLFVGGLAGAMTALLFAPKSGKRTRAQFQHQFMDLRDQITEAVEDAEDDALRRAHKATAKARHKVGDLQHRGQAIFDGK